MSDLNITDVKIRKLNNDNSLKAVVSITINNSFAVHDIKVVEGPKGLFVAMPSRKGQNDEYFDIAHPVTKEVRKTIQEKVLQAYNED